MKRYDRSPDRLPKDRFAKLLLGGIRDAGERREIVYDSGEFRLRLADGSGHTMLFQNISLGSQKKP
jgi:hypothetical protein